MVISFGTYEYDYAAIDDSFIVFKQHCLLHCLSCITVSYQQVKL